MNDFSLAGLQGREMRDLAVGIIGTDRTGAQAIRNLSGFGCRILAYDLRRNPAVEALVEGIESQKIGALGIDTCGGDEGIVHEDHRADILPSRNWFYREMAYGKWPTASPAPRS